MNVGKFVHENYYCGDMEAEEILAAILTSGDKASSKLVEENYYQGDWDIEEVMSALL